MYPSVAHLLSAMANEGRDDLAEVLAGNDGQWRVSVKRGKQACEEWLSGFEFRRKEQILDRSHGHAEYLRAHMNVSIHHRH